MYCQVYNKMFKDPEVKESFNRVIRDWLSKGYVRIVPKEECLLPDAYYLPIFGVFKTERESTKVRVVVDAKAKYNNKSLNDGVLSGPKLINDLV